MYNTFHLKAKTNEVHAAPRHVLCSQLIITAISNRLVNIQLDKSHFTFSVVLTAYIVRKK